MMPRVVAAVIVAVVSVAWTFEARADTPVVAPDVKGWGFNFARLPMDYRFDRSRLLFCLDTAIGYYTRADGETARTARRRHCANQSNTEGFGAVIAGRKDRALKAKTHVSARMVTCEIEKSFENYSVTEVAKSG